MPDGTTRLYYWMDDTNSVRSLVTWAGDSTGTSFSSRTNLYGIVQNSHFDVQQVGGKVYAISPTLGDWDGTIAALWVSADGINFTQRLDDTAGTPLPSLFNWSASGREYGGFSFVPTSEGPLSFVVYVFIPDSRGIAQSDIGLVRNFRPNIEPNVQFLDGKNYTIPQLQAQVLVIGTAGGLSEDENGGLDIVGSTANTVSLGYLDSDLDYAPSVIVHGGDGYNAYVELTNSTFTGTSTNKTPFSITDLSTPAIGTLYTNGTRRAMLFVTLQVDTTYEPTVSGSLVTEQQNGSSVRSFPVGLADQTSAHPITQVQVCAPINPNQVYYVTRTYPTSTSHPECLSIVSGSWHLVEE